jgi:hypothetical protein
MMIRCASVLMMMAAVLGGCASGAGTGRVVEPASAAQKASLLDKMKSLEGEWQSKDPQTGAMMTACVFRTTSGGTAVQEVMLPGTPHEMVNMYHMDGSTLVVTHYCAMGNQPRMRATSSDGTSIAFAFDSVTNKTAPDQTCMGKLTLEFVDADHLVARWGSVGGPEDHSPVFELTRKK